MYLSCMLLTTVQVLMYVITSREEAEVDDDPQMEVRALV
jgi:hypothetical protein